MNSVTTTYRPNDRAPWNLSRVVHLHRRAGFSGNWDELQRDLREGPEAAVDRFLSGQVSSERTPADFESMSALIGSSASSSADINRLKAWWLYRMLMTPDPLTERLTLMWHNHFATSNQEVDDVRLMKQQNDGFRKHARGKFVELLRSAAKDPALLIWLDADTNRREHANENLAREFLELFTLGEGHYTEQDVKEAARALTGWTQRRGQFRFINQWHDAGIKTLLGDTGTWDGDDLIRIACQASATAERLSWRLCQEFLAPSLISNEVVKSVADRLRRSELDIGDAVAMILRSELFFDDSNLGAKVCPPVPWMIGLIRSLSLDAPPPSTLLLAEWSAKMGQDLFLPPNVFGWPGGMSWITARTMVARRNFAATLLRGGLHSGVKSIDLAKLASEHGFDQPSEQQAYFTQLLTGRRRPPAGADAFPAVRFSDHPDKLTDPENVAAHRHVLSIACSPSFQMG